MGLDNLARNNAHFAHATTAIRTAVIEFKAGMKTRLQQVGTPFNQELVPAGAHGNLRGHDFEHVVHHFEQINRFGRQRLGKALGDLLFQLPPCAFGRMLTDAFPYSRLQRNDQLVVALQMESHVGQFLALCKHSLRKNFLTWQWTLAHFLRLVKRP